MQKFFRRSELYCIIAGDTMERNMLINNVNVRPYLVGDTAYALRPYLMIAYHSGHLPPRNKGSNSVLIVERAYGSLDRIILR